MPDPGAGAASSAPAPDLIGRILDGIDRLSDWGAWASVLCIVGILVLIVGEVWRATSSTSVLRSPGNSPRS